jgi:hypothetical protein
MVEALKARGIDVPYVVKINEGQITQALPHGRRQSVKSHAFLALCGVASLDSHSKLETRNFFIAGE